MAVAVREVAGVAQPRPAGRGVGDASVGEAEHARFPRTQAGRGVGELVGPVAVGGPGGGDHGGWRACCRVLRENPSGQEGFVVWVSEDCQKRRQG